MKVYPVILHFPMEKFIQRKIHIDSRTIFDDRLGATMNANYVASIVVSHRDCRLWVNNYDVHVAVHVVNDTTLIVSVESAPGIYSHNSIHSINNIHVTQIPSNVIHLSRFDGPEWNFIVIRLKEKMTHDNFSVYACLV